MLQQTLKKSSQLLIRNGLLAEEDEEVFSYCFEVFFFSVLNWGSIVWLAIWQGEVVRTAAYLGIFLLLRRFCGGYHASTHMRCYGMTMGCYLLVSMLWRVEGGNGALWFSVLFALLANLLLLYFAPVDTANKPFLPGEQAQFRRKSLHAIFILDVLLLILIVDHQIPWLLCITTTMLQSAITVAAGHWANHRKEERSL